VRNTIVDEEKWWCTSVSHLTLAEREVVMKRKVMGPLSSLLKRMSGAKDCN